MKGVADERRSGAIPGQTGDRSLDSVRVNSGSAPPPPPGRLCPDANFCLRWVDPPTSGARSELPWDCADSSPKYT